jgi:hypothetical protein
MAASAEPGTGYRHSATVTVTDDLALQELLRQPVDFGCKPYVQMMPEGALAVTVIGTEGDLRRLAEHGREVSVHPLPEERAEVGAGDRFQAGHVVPRGFGRKDPGR